MNFEKHLLTCLLEEGSEVIKDASKSIRFGLEDRNVLNPTGPTNRERLVVELNDFMAVVELLVDKNILPPDWQNQELKQQKVEKVFKFIQYAERRGELSI